MIQAMEEPDFDGVVRTLGNVMEVVTFKMHPELQQVKDDLMQAGAAGTLMSGSGPTILGLFSEAEKARQAFYYLRGRYPHTFLCSSYSGSGGDMEKRLIPVTLDNYKPLSELVLRL